MDSEETNLREPLSSLAVYTKYNQLFVLFQYYDGSGTKVFHYRHMMAFRFQPILTIADAAAGLSLPSTDWH